MVRQIVDRLHVSESDIGVCRYLRSRLSKEGKSKAQWPARKEAYKLALKIHHENQDMYVSVMSGVFNEE